MHVLKAPTQGGCFSLMKDWVSQSQNKDLGRSTGFPELFNTITKAETDTLLWHFINFFQIAVLLLK